MTDPPYQYEKDKILPAKAASNSCRHAWTLKPSQCRLLQHGRRPSPNSIYNVAAYCPKCRSHLDMTMDFCLQGDAITPCPSKAFPLHHFIYRPQLSQERQTFGSASKSEAVRNLVDTQQFQCTTSRCSAKLTVKTRPPRLTPEHVKLLTDPISIEIRAKKAIAENMDRLEGHPIPPPQEILTNLAVYIDNALTKPERRRIPGHNKKWLLCFGDPCLDLLRYLGFSREVIHHN